MLKNFINCSVRTKKFDIIKVRKKLILAKLFLDKISSMWILKLHSKNISTLNRSLLDLSPQVKKPESIPPTPVILVESVSKILRELLSSLVNCLQSTASKSMYTRNRCYDKGRNCSWFSMKMLIGSICSLLFFCFLNVSASSNGKSQFVDRELNKNVTIQEGEIGTENTVRC